MLFDRILFAENARRRVIASSLQLAEVLIERKINIQLKINGLFTVSAVCLSVKRSEFFNAKVGHALLAELHG